MKLIKLLLVAGAALLLFAYWPTIKEKFQNGGKDVSLEKVRSSVTDAVNSLKPPTNPTSR